jgi:peroxygenase
MKKDDIRRMYDGSIFQFKADEYARKQKQAIKPYGR